MKKYFLILPLFVFFLVGFAHQAYARTYTTSFPLTENPISESGNWINGSSTGLDWGTPQTTPGFVGGVDDEVQYADPTAVLTGTWGPNQTVTATVHSVNATDTYDQEVELRLRTTITAHSITGYEVMFRTPNNASAYVNIARWQGALGSFSLISENNGIGVSNGDVVKASMIGNVIDVYINGTMVASTTDDMYRSGSPGLGFNFGCANTYANFGFSSYTATDQIPNNIMEIQSASDYENSGNTLSCAFQDPPELGDTVIVGLNWYNGTKNSSTITSVKDANSNSFVLTPKSSFAPEGVAGAGAEYIAYLLSAPANASNTVTATFGTAGTYMNAFCEDFTYSEGESASFDSDAVASGTGSTTVGAPTVPVSGSNDILYAVVGDSGAITSVNSPWSVAGGGIPPDGIAAGYDADATSSTALSMDTQSTGDIWDALGASFEYTATLSAPTNASGYAWGNKMGWVNFGTQTGGIEVYTTTVQGYAWSQNFGWINLAPASSGVINDGNGNLSGYAWGQNVGYINFQGVTIDQSGVFHGIASSTIAGTLVFDSSTYTAGTSSVCTYCNVTTTWMAPAGASLGVSAVNINTATNGTNPTAITLTANATTSVNINATITDNSCGEITGGTTTILLYRSGVTSSSCLTGSGNGVSTNLNCYLASAFTASSTCSSGSQNTTTTFPVEYFAQATDASSSYPSQNWIGTIIFNDSGHATSSADSTHATSTNDFATTIALNVTTSSIKYGTLAASSTTNGVNQTTTVQNSGNSSTTLKISGTAMVTGSKSIATSSQHYATSTFSFGGSEQSLSGSATAVSGFLLTSPTSTTNVQSTIFWGLIVPNGSATGTYTGTNTFTAVFSS